jgi:hypothetical protein
MDSILGKVIAAILALLAVALVAVAFFVSYEHDRTSNLVGQLPGDVCAKATLAIKDIMALNISGKEYTAPADPAAAAAMCSDNTDVVFSLERWLSRGPRTCRAREA